MKKSYWLFTIVLVATFMLAACGGGAAPSPSGGVKAAPTDAVAKPADKPVAQPTSRPAQPAVEQPASDAIELANVTAGLNELNSYQSSFTMTFEGTEDGQPKSSTLSFTEAFVKDPPAKHTSITGFGAMLGSGAASDQGAIETIEVNGKQYSKIGDTCVQVTADSGPQANAMFNLDSIIGNVRGAQKLGNETLNGVPTEHYKIDASGLAGLGYTNGQGEVWVAKPGDFVVKYTFEATGKDMFFGNTGTEGTIKWVYEISQINQPIDIQPPANCSGAAEDIPIMADAEEQSAMGSMTTYTSPSKFEDVVAFYQKEMPTQGWTEKEGGMSTEGFAQKTYTKDNRTVQIMITADSSSGKTSVLITEEK
jgi:hypothetical protein